MFHLHGFCPAMHSCIEAGDRRQPRLGRALALLLFATLVSGLGSAQATEPCSSCALAGTSSPEGDEASLRVPPTASPGGHRQVLLEIYTGANCGACPNADVERDKLKQSLNGDRYVVLEHHYGFGVPSLDLMALPEVDDELIPAFPIFGIPSIIVDRAHETFLPNEMRQEIDRRSSIPPPVDIVFDSQWNATQRIATVEIEMTFHSQTSGDLRTNCVLAEDPVIGSGPGYDQHSNFNDDPEHPYYQAGDPIPDYPHRFVSRVFMDGPWGSQDNNIPDPALAGQTYSETLQAAVPAFVDAEKTWVVCYVANEGEAAGQRMVLDATWARLGADSPDPPLFWDYLETGTVSRWSLSSP